MEILYFCLFLLSLSALQVESEEVVSEPEEIPWVQTKEWKREWRKVKYQAYKLYGAQCHLCGKTPKEDGVKLHVDHIQPKSKYPLISLQLKNLQILCDEHNWSKSNVDETDWR